MHIYNILVLNGCEEKFESLITNFNLVNSKKLATIVKKEEIVAHPKEMSNDNRND